jgi:hypothetical protein
MLAFAKGKKLEQPQWWIEQTKDCQGIADQTIRFAPHPPGRAVLAESAGCFSHRTPLPAHLTVKPAPLAGAPKVVEEQAERTC